MSVRAISLKKFIYFLRSIEVEYIQRANTGPVQGILLIKVIKGWNS